jgi:hypothetical protein
MGRWDDEPVELGDEEELPEGEWELDPNDPTHPDYDLSEAHGYSDWEPASKPLLGRNGVILFVAVVVIAAIVVPVLLQATR